MKRFVVLVAGLALGLVNDSARGGPLGPAADFNVFVFGNDTQSSTDADGRVAVGGNASFSNYSAGQVLSFNPARFDLIVGGNLTFTNGSVNKGSVYVGGTPSLTSVSIGGSLVTFPNPSPIDFASAQTQLKNSSLSLSALAANGATQFAFGTLNLTGAQPAQNVFLVNGSDLAAANSFVINTPAGSTTVVNINGLSDQIQNLGFTLNGTDNRRVLYNFFEATSLTTSGVGVQGSILAPLADYSFDNGNVNGHIIVNNLSGGGQANQSAVPEPGSLMLAGLGLLGLAGYGWWRWGANQRA